MLTDAERIIGLYQRHARAWAAAREDLFGGPLIEVGWLDRFLRMLPPCPAVLDLGCGSGEPIGRYLAEKGCHLTGVDAALEMITMWKGRLPQHAWHVADMRSLSLGRLFDGVLAWDSFFHFSHDDQRRMFPVFRAHAGSGAPLMFTSGPSHGVAMGTFGGEPLYHASLDAAEYRSLLGEHGFDIVAHKVGDPACGGRTVWLACLR
jgi:SAM-dependent methyltransferase